MIQAPAWAKDAIPTPRGWVRKPGGELLKSQKISDAEIAEYMGESTPAPAPAPTPKPAPPAEPAPLNEAPPSKDLMSYTRRELEAMAEQYGLELQGNYTKTQLSEALEAHLLSE